MTDLAVAPSRSPVRSLGREISPRAARAAIVVLVVTGAAAGYFATSTDVTAQAVAAAGSDLTRLLRFMALLKTTMAAAALAAVVWRLGVASDPRWLLGYALAGTAMGAGPGLIWGMAHVGFGALLLHGGLFACLVILWRDPAVSARLSALLAARTGSR